MDERECCDCGSRIEDGEQCVALSGGPADLCITCLESRMRRSRRYREMEQRLRQSREEEASGGQEGGGRDGLAEGP